MTVSLFFISHFIPISLRLLKPNSSPTLRC